MEKCLAQVWRPWFAVLGMTLLLVGCALPPDGVGVQEDSNLNIMLEAAPEGKDGDHLIVMLTDAAGAPISDATVAMEGNMNHAGMVPVVTEGVQDGDDGVADGHYRAPFAFTMLGDWIITVQVTHADGSVISQNLDVRVSEAGVTGDLVATATHDHAEEHEAAEHDHVDEHVDEDLAHATGVHAAAVHIHDPMARPAPLVGGTGAVYFLFHNGTDADVRLFGAETPAAGAVEIHEIVNDNGTMRMRQLVDGIVLGPDESVNLAPGGLHMMLIDLAAPLVEGESITLTLHFDGADDLTFAVPVVSMDDLSAEGATDHNH